MTFETKLNIGDKVWGIDGGGINGGRISEQEIKDIRIFFNPESTIVSQPEIIYGTSYSCIHEVGENKWWWRTREDLVKHLLEG